MQDFQSSIKIAGLTKISLIDFPGKISAIIFTRGCNMLCPFCHNSELVLPESYAELIDINYITDFLEKRTGKLDGIVITGGEPTMHKGLIPFLKYLKKLGYKTKLDTNGTNPTVIKEIIAANLIDYIAMDIKAPFEKYDEICGKKMNITPIKETINILKSSKIEVEFRTTEIPGFHNEEDMKKITQIAEGCKYTINEFINSEKNISNVMLKNIVK